MRYLRLIFLPTCATPEVAPGLLITRPYPYLSYLSYLFFCNFFIKYVRGRPRFTCAVVRDYCLRGRPRVFAWSSAIILVARLSAISLRGHPRFGIRAHARPSAIIVSARLSATSLRGHPRSCICVLARSSAIIVSVRGCCAVIRDFAAYRNKHDHPYLCAAWTCLRSFFFEFVFLHS